MRSNVFVSVVVTKRDFAIVKGFVDSRKEFGGIVVVLPVGGVGRRISAASPNVMCPAMPFKVFTEFYDFASS
jgi:hypothetical protein